MDVKTAIIIGAGMGGIALAGRLARSGYRVAVYEANNKPGGRVDYLKQDGFYFDTGPTLFLMPEVFAETYRALGTHMEDHLDLMRIDPSYRIHFHDGSYLDLSADLVKMRSQLDAIEPGSFERYLKFLAEGYRHYNISLEKFVGRNFSSYLDYFSPANLPMLWQLKALQKHATNTARYFKNPRLQAAFSFQNMYLGLSPFDAPATYSLLQYTELADGIWLPKGGYYKVVESLVDVIQKTGVKIYYNSPVASIDIKEGRAASVTLASGECIPADLIIANADLPYVYRELLPQDGMAQRLSKKKYTSSALMFYWGIQGERSPELLHHNVFLADNKYRQSFKQIFSDRTLPDEPSFYVNASSRSDPSLAPHDGDSLMILIPVGHLDDARPQNWQSLQARAKDFVLGRLADIGVPDLESKIAYEVEWNPNFYREHYNLEKGAAFGLSHNFTQVGYLRPHNRHPRYKNLYFVGASTHPGTGVPIVLLSAKLVAERIQKEIPVTSQRLHTVSALVRNT